MDSADFAQLSPASQRDYRYYFRTFSGAFGHMSMLAMDEGKLHAIRNAYKSKPNQWNAIRARMKAVTEHFMALHRGAMPVNPWVLSKRLKVKQSDANKPWPRDVLERVFAAASPQFRALLTVYLLTAQRGSDVTTFNAAQYDRQARTITFRQKKTDTAMTLHVPDALAEIFEAAPGVGPAKLPRLATRARQTGSLLLTPRGYPWTLDNAQQTLAALLKRLELPRYTLHGLRSTGPTALRQEGWANPALRPLTGHNSDSNLEVYLRHADTAPLTRQAQEALSDLFGGLVAKPVPNRQTGDGSEAA
jgi:integrase